VSKVDLHIHSTASDGRLSPADIVRTAAESGLAFIAIADHDIVDGIIPALEAARAFPALKVIPGVEISTDVPHGEVHVLGYFIDYTDRNLGASLKRFRDSRLERAQKMIAKLKNFGINVEWPRVQEIAGAGSVGRPHIAQAMLEKGYITSIREAFAKYIGREGPAYVEREKMTPVEAVELIVRAHGLAVLAHPFTTANLEATVSELKAAGLAGLETYYDGYNTEQINRLLSLAKDHELIPTGGSDYHGLEAATETAIGGVDVPIECARQLVMLAEKQGLKLAYQ